MFDGYGLINNMKCQEAPRFGFINELFHPRFKTYRYTYTIHIADSFFYIMLMEMNNALKFIKFSPTYHHVVLTHLPK